MKGRSSLQGSENQTWQQISVITDEVTSHLLSQVFFDLGAHSVTFKDSADDAIYEPPPGTAPLWTRTEVVALFDADTDLEIIKQSASNQLAGLNMDTWQTEVLVDQVWERAWLDHFRPLHFGERLWICPSEQAPPDDAGICLKLDPGLAFGTGTHPTTALCLEWLAGCDLTDMQVIDFGCGSGVLAIASVLLGAKRVFAVDIDDQALTATRTNARKNGVEAQVQTFYPNNLPSIEVDLVIANILAQPLCDLAPNIAALVRPDGHLVLSGVLEDQVDRVVRAYAQDITFENHCYSDNWARMNGVKKNASPK